MLIASYIPHPVKHPRHEHTSPYTAHDRPPDHSAIHLHPTANHFLVSLEKQKAVVWGEALPELDEITEKVKKTGKEIRKAEKVNDQASLDAFW